jgi:hypothetical protein
MPDTIARAYLRRAARVFLKASQRNDEHTPSKIVDFGDEIDVTTTSIMNTILMSPITIHQP